jgi:hypothetical protein
MLQVLRRALVSYKKEVWNMKKEVREAFRVHFKWTVLEYAKVSRTVAKACREFEVPRSTFDRHIIWGPRESPGTLSAIMGLKPQNPASTALSCEAA